MKTHPSKMSDFQVARHYGPAALFGRIIRGWLSAPDTDAPENHLTINRDNIEVLENLLHHIIAQLNALPKRSAARQKLQDQWLTFEMVLVAAARQIRNKGGETDRQVVLIYQGELWKSSYYTLDISIDGRRITQASICGLI